MALLLQSPANFESVANQFTITYRNGGTTDKDSNIYLYVDGTGSLIDINDITCDSVTCVFDTLLSTGSYAIYLQQYGQVTDISNIDVAIQGTTAGQVTLAEGASVTLDSGMDLNQMELVGGSIFLALASAYGFRLLRDQILNRR